MTEYGRDTIGNVGMQAACLFCRRGSPGLLVQPRSENRCAVKPGMVGMDAVAAGETGGNGVPACAVVG
jgi:hypothetical protein